MKKILIASICFITIMGCRKSQFDAVERTSGEADFTRYVSVGNSLTQGFADGGLYAESQQNSYPKIIAEQMEKVDPDMGDFIQPTVIGNGSGYIHLDYIDGEIEVIQPNDPGGYSEDGSWSSWGGGGSSSLYNNLGISGITLDQCVALDDNEKIINGVILGGVDIPLVFTQPGNPFSRFLEWGSPVDGFTPSPDNVIQYVDHVRNSNATFFTCWMGNNDVLGWATSGGVSTGIDLSFVGLGSLDFNALADPGTFQIKYDSLMSAFNSIGAKGVCATIPDVTIIPYFKQFTTQSLKDDYGYSAVWIETGTGDVRPATDADLIVLTAKDTIENGAGSSETQYLQNSLVLDAAEVAQCQSVTSAINSAIKNVAGSYGFGVVDMATFFTDLQPAQSFDGIEITSEYISGGGFSLDGVHLNSRGYAIAANEFIKTINSTYGSNIPEVAVGNFSGVIFP